MFGILSMGMASVFPVVLLLSISFFVLVVLENVREKKLIIFGRILVALLWISAFLTVSTGVYGMIRRGQMIAQRREGISAPAAEPDKARAQMRKEMLERIKKRQAERAEGK